QLNDLLQYLGQFAFRAPVPAYRHDAAIFFELRGWASSDATPAGAPRRPASDRPVLADILERLEAFA
ncbi:MAG TPA: dihydrodipicolinate synthase family protein, partial [Aquihabitans sp.]|nr:dihydrodipicolinate synthase family protein [Aquihabitans sp.]